MDRGRDERRVAGGVSDEALASRARAGDRACFGMLVDRYQGRIYALAMSRLRDRHDAEEVTQEALLRAWRSIRTYREGEPVSPWVLTIARREIVNVVRRRKKAARDKTRRTPGRETGVEAGGDRGGGSGAGSGVWVTAREALSPEAYEAIWLRYREDLDPGQIAKVMGRSRVGVRVLLHRARKTLSEILEAQGNERGNEHVTGHGTAQVARRGAVAVQEVLR